MPKAKAYTSTDGVVTWRVRFRHGTKNTSETFTTEREAKAFASDVEHHGADYAVRLRDSDHWTNVTPSLDEVADLFLEHKAKNVRSDRTVADYRAAYQRWIAPKLGRRNVGAIAQRDVQEMVEWMRAPTDGRKALSSKSVAHHHALLHQMVSWSMSETRGWVRTDPCANTELPRRTKTPPKGLKPAEWDALYRALRLINQDAADLALFLVHSGWRWSEAGGLSVWDVDLGDPVRVTMGRVLRRNAAGQYVVVEDAKSEAGQRQVALPASAGLMVARRMVTAQPGGLLFTTQNGAAWNYAHFRERYWNPAVKAANLPRTPTPHALRHTHVWWMVLSGAALPELQSRIGHASIKTTIDVYGRMVTDVSGKVLGEFDRYAGGAHGPRALD